MGGNGRKGAQIVCAYNKGDGQEAGPEIGVFLIGFQVVFVIGWLRKGCISKWFLGGLFSGRSIAALGSSTSAAGTATRSTITAGCSATTASTAIATTSTAATATATTVAATTAAGVGRSFGSNVVVEAVQSFRLRTVEIEPPVADEVLLVKNGSIGTEEAVSC